MLWPLIKMFTILRYRTRSFSSYEMNFSARRKQLKIERYTEQSYYNTLLTLFKVFHLR